jgi:hypothetical protein
MKYKKLMEAIDNTYLHDYLLDDACYVESLWEQVNEQVEKANQRIKELLIQREYLEKAMDQNDDNYALEEDSLQDVEEEDELIQDYGLEDYEADWYL